MSSETRKYLIRFSRTTFISCSFKRFFFSFLISDANLPFYQKALLAGFSGACGGLVGTPGDLINVRMQNDMKVPLAERRNYKHAIDGLVRISREEGMSKLFNGMFLDFFLLAKMQLWKASCSSYRLVVHAK